LFVLTLEQGRMSLWMWRHLPHGWQVIFMGIPIIGVSREK
jgi:uncharacterized protein YbdZ (MbtH family)